MKHPQELVVRNAVDGDAEAMGLLHVRAWQSAYRGVMPDAYLDGLQAEERVAMWRSRISRTELPPLLVAELAGDVVGFAAFGPARGEPDPTGVGQLYAMNIDPAHWGKGIGRALLHEVTTALTAMMFREAVLWVVPENARARALYEAEGWTEDGGVQTEDVLGATVREIRYRRPLAVRR